MQGTRLSSRECANTQDVITPAARSIDRSVRTVRESPGEYRCQSHLSLVPVRIPGQVSRAPDHPPGAQRRTCDSPIPCGSSQRAELCSQDMSHMRATLAAFHARRDCEPVVDESSVRAWRAARSTRSAWAAQPSNGGGRAPAAPYECQGSWPQDAARVSTQHPRGSSFEPMRRPTPAQRHDTGSKPEPVGKSAARRLAITAHAPIPQRPRRTNMGRE